MLIACGLSLAWLMAIILPLVLYQYFAISPPDIFGDVHTSVWSAYLAPIHLIKWTPTISSVDPLVALTPTFALMFAFWSVVLSVVVHGLRWLRRRGGPTSHQPSS